MSPTPELTCTACGEPVPADSNACPGCGAMVGAPSSGFGLDPDVEPAPKPARKPPPRVEDEGGPSEKTVAEKREEKEVEKPKGETVRMSLADATQAWNEDAPTTTVPDEHGEHGDDADAPAKSRALLFILLGLVVAAAIALALLL